MGKVRERLRNLIRTPGRKIVQYVRGDLPAKVDELQGEMRQVKETVEELQEQLEDLAARKEDKTAAAAQEEGEEEGVTGRTVRAIREEYELSRDELAQLLEVSPKTVASWENGRSTPGADNRIKIANLREKSREEVDQTLGRVEAGPPLEPDDIVELRRQFGVTQKELAEKLDVSPNTVSNWERGASRPRDKSVEKLRRFRQEQESGDSPASRIKQLRKKAGLSQKQLAEELGVSSGTVSSWETGKTTPSELYVQALEQVAQGGG